jgi:predicted nucleotidyltransferase component of viral defense system
MIDLGTLKRIAKVKGIANVGYAEKDYFQEIVLLAVSRELPDLVFKGGTALYKFHKLNRFSEDLDFTGTVESNDIGGISSYIGDFGYKTDVEIKEVENGILATFIIRGFLYRGTAVSAARLRVDVNSGTSIELPPEWLTLSSLYPDLPSFGIKVLAIDEILAEKIRAMVTRKKARDAYDVYYLLKTGIRPNPGILERKMAYYNVKLDARSLSTALEECGRIWDTELRTIVDKLPDFKIVKDEITRSLAGV